MKTEDFEKLSSSIQEKLGKENAGLILDDLMTIRTDYDKMNNEALKSKSDYDELNKKYNSVLEVNASLFQQTGSKVPGKNDKDPEDDEGKKKKTFSLKDCFDEKRKF